MGFKSTEWAYTVEGLTGPQRAVLVALAHCMNDKTGRCFPSQEDLAGMTMLGEKTVRRALGGLEASGVITRVKKFKGRYRTNDDYSFNRDFRSERPPVTVTAGQPDHRSQSPSPPVTQSFTTGQSDRAVIPTGSTTGSHQEVNALEHDFGAFYAAWPKKRDKPAAQRAWAKAIKKVDPALIIAKAIAYRDNPHIAEKQFIPYPASWLNAEGWDDELDGPREYRTNKPTPTERAMHTLALASQFLPPKEIAS